MECVYLEALREEFRKYADRKGLLFEVRPSGEHYETWLLRTTKGHEFPLMTFPLSLEKVSPHARRHIEETFSRLLNGPSDDDPPDSGLTDDPDENAETGQSHTQVRQELWELVKNWSQG